MIDLTTYIRQLCSILPKKWGTDTEKRTPKQLSAWLRRIQIRCSGDIEELWHTYNTGRDGLSTHTTAGAKSVVAYLLGFHPFQYMRAWGTLQRATKRHPDIFEVFKSGYDCIDLGCGSGAISSAAEDCIGPSERWLGVDLSKPALQVARMASKAKQTKTIKTSLHDFHFDRYLTADSDKPLLVCLGYTANEMRGRIAEQFYQTLLESVSSLKAARPVLLFWLEPAQEEQAVFMHKIREQARTSGLTTLYPCPHQDECPMGTGTAKKQRDRCYSEVMIEGKDMPPAVLFEGAPGPAQIRSRLGVSAYVFWNDHRAPANFKSSKGIFVGRPREKNGTQKRLICTPSAELTKKQGDTQTLRGQTL